MGKAETRFTEQVKDFLDDCPKTWYTKTQQVGIIGTPDLLICANGYFVGAEIKKDITARVSPMQEHTLATITKCHGIGVVVRPENFENFKKLVLSLLGLPAPKNVHKATYSTPPQTEPSSSQEAPPST